MCGQICGNICPMHPNERRSKNGPSKNPNLTTPEDYVVLTLLILKDEELKDITRNAHRKLEISMPAAMLCKSPVNCSGETCSSIGKRKTKYACIVDAHESMRIRMEGAPHRYHEDHIAAKGLNSSSHHNLVHKFIPMPQAMKIPDAKAAVEK